MRIQASQMPYQASAQRFGVLNNVDVPKQLTALAELVRSPNGWYRGGDGKRLRDICGLLIVFRYGSPLPEDDSALETFKEQLSPAGARLLQELIDSQRPYMPKFDPNVEAVITEVAAIVEEVTPEVEEVTPEDPRKNRPVSAGSGYSGDYRYWKDGRYWLVPTNEWGARHYPTWRD